MDNVKEILKALRRVGDELNLVPGRLVHAEQFAYVAGTAKRISKRFGNALGDVRAYAIILKNRETIDGTDTVLEFLVNSHSNKTDTYALLNAGAGMYVTPGASYEMAVAHDLAELTLDVKGTQKSDFATDRAVTARLWIYQLVPAFKQAEKGCA